MARRLATVGYYLVLPNLYYRTGLLELNLSEAKRPGDPPRAPIRELSMSLTVDLVLDDTAAMFAYLATQPAARSDAVACLGYCMSAQHAINAAARYAERVRAAASIYGTWLMTDRADSPHLQARKASGELYFACAETDPWAPMELVQNLKNDLARSKVNAVVEVYPGAHHGFAFPQRPTYHKLAAERHWERLFALLKRRLPY